MTSNFRIYGPPSHTPDTFSVSVCKDKEGSWNISVTASSPTCKGILWSMRDVTSIPPQDYQHLIVGQALEVLMGDLVRDLPNTQERAQFVASGGLYEQTTMF